MGTTAILAFTSALGVSDDGRVDLSQGQSVGVPEAYSESVLGDGEISKREIDGRFSTFNGLDGEPLTTTDGRLIVQGLTTDGVEFCGITSTQGLANVRGLEGGSVFALLQEGADEPVLASCDEVIELAEAEAGEAEAVAPAASVAITGLPEVGDAEAGEPEALLADGEITVDEVAGSSPVILTAEEAAAIGDVESFADTIDSINLTEVPLDGDEVGYRVSINGGNTFTVEGADGQEYCGNSSSAFSAGVRGLDTDLINTADTGPASCEDFLTGFKGPGE